MQFLGGIWAGITYVFNVFTLSPTPWSEGLDQFPISKVNDGPFGELLKGPSFKPPTGRPEGPGSDFTCEYPEMTGWSPCSTPDNRGCWLRNGKTGEEYNITTDYENITTTPIGIERRYVLDLTDESLNLDGLDFPEAKIFNKQYPGPWIQACWGDVRPRCSNALDHCCVANASNRLSPSRSTTGSNSMELLSTGTEFDNC